ncbi:hypothetical protein G6F63_015514 [Rhizopus arrhizus]|nr:hypothetical protein G6F63_015514 [Rhizopus arrhizus]
MSLLIADTAAEITTMLRMVAAEVMPRRGDITAGRELAPVDLVAGFLQCGIETAVRDGGQERAHDQLISDHQLGLGISGCGQQRGGKQHFDSVASIHDVSSL